MSTSWIDPKAALPSPGAVSAKATVIEGIAHNGRPCRIIDNTGSVAPGDLQAVLDALIAERRFGLGGLSAHGGQAIPLDHPTATHIQFGDQLYRILLFPYEARIEAF